MKDTELRRWTRHEYDRMIRAGIFSPGERVELVHGEILRMTPQSSAHATAIRLGVAALQRVFVIDFVVQSQLPLALSETSEPEPDLSVLRGSPRDYLLGHPSSALLVVEISDTSLDGDRQRKMKVYAHAGIQD